jgi:drug/metabolite transporter (DMT)-like permease
MSRVVLGTRHPYAQLLARFLLISGIVVVQEQGISAGSSSLQEHKFDKSLVGIAAVLLASLTSGTAGVILENIYKSTASQASFEHSVWTRNVQLSIISIPFAILGVYFADPAKIQGGNFF